MSDTEGPDFMAEEADLYGKMSRAAVAAWKFFSMFRVEIDEANPAAPATVFFGKDINNKVQITLAKQVQKYCKEMRRLIRSCPRGGSAAASILQRKIYWFMTMALEHGVFTTVQHRFIWSYVNIVWDEVETEIKYTPDSD
jgi:hypothetical protein